MSDDRERLLASFALMLESSLVLSLQRYYSFEITGALDGCTVTVYDADQNKVTECSGESPLGMMGACCQELNAVRRIRPKGDDHV